MPSRTSLPLISIFKFANNAQIASRKDQAIHATNMKNKGILATSGGTLGVTTRRKEITLSTVPSTLKQGKNSLGRAFHPSINSAKGPIAPEAQTCDHPGALLRAPKEEIPMRYSESLTSDADSRSSCPVAMQVMTTSVTSIKEQLTQMSEAIIRLTKTMEEKDLQIATFVNHLKAQHDDKADPKVDLPKEETDEKEEPLVEKAEEKLDQATTFMGYLFIQQL
ncbi:hypothetical protein ACFX10_037772 [Malus domestica]